jgi:hypothetical protein
MPPRSVEELDAVSLHNQGINSCNLSISYISYSNLGSAEKEPTKNRLEEGKL